MIDPGWAAVIAAAVSLFLGLASIRRAATDTRRAQEREQQRQRADAYVQVLRIIELRGLAVQDEMYNYTETGDNAYNPFEPTLPNRTLHTPDRTDRAEARALLVAWGTTETRAAFEAWLGQVEAWEKKVSDWHYEAELNEPPSLSKADAEPERAAELAARTAMGDAVSREVQRS